jgi:uncharacterized membrane protein
MYAALVALALTRLRRPAFLPRVLETWTVSLALAGVIYSGYLTALELLVIRAICIWCVTSAVIVTAILVLALWEFRRTAPQRAS